MSQKNLRNYFTSTETNRTTISDSDSDSNSIESNNINVLVSTDITYYEELLKKKDDIKKVTKVHVNETGVSECWKHFGGLYIKNKHVMEKMKFCKICLDTDGTLKGFANSTSTTNYISHLRTIHNLDIKSGNRKKSEFITQMALESSSSKNNKYQNGRRIAEMCCWDLQPFKIVEREGFKKFVRFLNPNTVLPTDRTIAGTALNDVYANYLGHVKHFLESSPKNVTLVMDMWSDKYKHLSYVNVKIHFCKNFELKIVTLKTEIFPRPHTAIAVSEKINETLCEFNLQSKDICAVTDGGSNIVAALKIKKINRYGCIAHSMHRFLMHDLLHNERFSHINDIISKLKQIYRSLMWSSEELSKLQNLEEQSEVAKIILEAESILESMDVNDQFPTGDDDFTELLENALNSKTSSSLKNSVPTRWNSLLVMIESFSKNINIINIALLKVKRDPLIIPEMEKQLIKEFGEFLKIFENATKYLQGQHYPTISSCVFFYENIMSLMEKCETESCFQLTIDLCNFSLQHFGKRFRILKIHVVAALMDPCQKKWPTLEKYLKKIPEGADNSFELANDVLYPTTKHKIIMEEIKKIKLMEENELDSQPSTSQTVEPSVKKQKISTTRQEMLDFMGGCRSQTNDIEEEVQKYVDTEVLEIESLDWWQHHKQIFPNVAKLANICFGIPATSASSEQAFSVAGNCVNSKRSRLHPATIKKQLFIHDNKNIVEPFLSK